MATTSQGGVLGFGPQAGKEIAVVSGNWYRHKATVVDLAVNDDQRMGPPEVGGRPVPSMVYKGGVMVGGGMTIHPRLEGSVGWLLKGALGYSTVTAGSGAIKNHVFALSPSNPSYVPWMGFRKYIPYSGDAGDYGLGETYRDCKITNFVLTLGNDGLISARVDALGRMFTLEESPTWGTASGSTGGWNTAGEFEDFESVPISSVVGGYINVPTFGNLPVVAAQVGWQNQPLDMRQEKVYGSPYLEDITIVSRAMTFDLTVKWKNPDLYRQILTGSVDGTAWSATPFTSAIEIYAMSPSNMPTESLPYHLKITVANAALNLNGGIQLAGNNALSMRFTGNAMDVAGSDYALIELRNQVANYTWPT